MNRRQTIWLVGVAVLLFSPTIALGQDGSRWYAGGVIGVSALSADAEHAVDQDSLVVSLYKPETGAAANAFAGAHLSDYLTLQANYIWNRNALTLVSSRGDSSGTVFYEQPRDSTQHAVIGDVLVYFRAHQSRFRPYLSVGAGFLRLTSSPDGPSVIRGLEPPADRLEEWRPVLRVAVGIDFRTGSRWRVRYSFSESLSRNPISQALTPPAGRRLANFQNLVGLVRSF